MSTMNRLKWLCFFLAVVVIVVGSSQCSDKHTDSSSDAQKYRNLSDSAQYVGMQVCMQCHSGIHESFLKTGMGKSFDHASKKKSSAVFTGHRVVEDTAGNYSYFPYWKGDSLVFREFRINRGDTIFSRDEIITYIVGSGQHTNSHLILNQGYLFQAPLTFYTQEKKWDLPPGFENGANSRFERIIGLECISCHNAYPEFVQGSENKFLSIPKGIDCERCHGPGSIHVTEKQQGIIIDTSKYIDYSIVNPAKLSVNLQFDICQRCHLQGNAVLADGKSFLDFKPGMRLHDVMDVYLPRYANSNERFIMASHADRLKQSACFISMEKRHVNTEALRPYKSALTCVTCHNPHVSVKETGTDHFNLKCISCHSAEKVQVCPEVKTEKNNSCVSCHMPLTGSTDIPHVSIHDHYIRKSYHSAAIENGAFVDLKSINNPSPSAKSRTKAYLQQFEKFNPGDFYLLDSAEAILNRNGGRSADSLFRLYVQLDYLRNDYQGLVNYVYRKDILNLVFFVIGNRSYSNEDAWTAYRIGEAFTKQELHQPALLFYGLAVKLAPYYFEFSNKFGYSALMNRNIPLASQVFKRIVSETPSFAPAWSNLSYVSLINSDFKSSLYHAEKALSLDYNYVQARLNKAGALNAMGKINEALVEIEIVLILDPKNEQALNAKRILAEGENE